MTKEELIELAIKVRAGKATPEEVKAFFEQFKEKVADLNQYLKSVTSGNPMQS